MTGVSLFPGLVRNLGRPGTQSRGLVGEFQCGDDGGRTGGNPHEGLEEITSVVHWTRGTLAGDCELLQQDVQASAQHRQLAKSTHMTI